MTQHAHRSHRQPVKISYPRALAIAIGFGTSFLIADIAQAATTVVSIASQSVVRVVVVPDDPTKLRSMGSGFKVGPGQYVTNRHVVADALNGGYQVWIVPSQQDSKPLPAQVRATSTADLALLVADDTSAEPLALEPDVPEPTQGVIAIGYPHQMDQILGIGDNKPSLPDATVGAVINTGDSGENSDAIVTRLVHSANIWPGNSGGPLIDQCGRVLGVNTWTHAEAGLAQQSIAIAAHDLQKFLIANGVSAALDTRACVDGKLEISPTVPGEADAPHAERPTISASPDNSEEIGAIILGLVLFGGAAFGIFALHRHVQRRNAIEERENEARESDEW